MDGAGNGGRNGRVITVVSVNGGRSLGMLKVGVEEEQRGRETRIP